MLRQARTMRPEAVQSGGGGHALQGICLDHFSDEMAIWRRHPCQLICCGTVVLHLHEHMLLSMRCVLVALKAIFLICLKAGILSQAVMLLAAGKPVWRPPPYGWTHMFRMTALLNAETVA